MSANDVRATLAEESILLDIMIGCLQTVDENRLKNKLAREIRTSWIRFLRERRHAGVTLQQMNVDAELLADLTQERGQVDEYVRITKDPRDFCEQWDEFLKCEESLLDDLIKLYHQP